MCDTSSNITEICRNNVAYCFKCKENYFNLGPFTECKSNCDGDNIFENSNT